MIQHQRRSRILEVLRQRRTCSISELQNELGVSPVTLYRDLRQLDQDNLVRRVHGGVVLPESEKIESRFSIRLQANRAAKERIGRSVAGQVKEGWAIFVDASSTSYIFARELATRGLASLTLATNSPQIPLEFEEQPQIRVISTGGELLHELNAFAGPLAISQLSTLHFDAAYVSCAGVSRSSGATTDSPLLAEILRTAARNSRHVTLLADSSKFSRRALLTSLRLEELDRIVTDSNVPEQSVRELHEGGVDVEIVILE